MIGGGPVELGWACAEDLISGFHFGLHISSEIHKIQSIIIISNPYLSSDII
ncbi:hypothetical protein HanRHA438_Chr15g0718071 [Helianthus annuus]|nr:hypothetical protein HanRHA438_Chr15g0718071 [Helianthus annuus]